MKCHSPKHRQDKSHALKPLHIAVLLMATMAVSISFSIVLPVLPFMIERMGGRFTDSGLIATHTGLLTAIYMLALAIGAPQWGKWCDRMGSYWIIAIGLAGLAATLALFSFFENIVLIYLGRFLGGLFTAAVSPAAMAVISRHKASDEWKARRLSWIGLASIAGSMIGPTFGGFAVRLAERNAWAHALAAPFLLAAVITAVAAALALMIFPRRTDQKSEPTPAETLLSRQGILLRLLILSFIAALGIGSFHVLLTIRSKQVLALDPYQIGLMFSECSLVMFLAQAIVFSPLVKPPATRYLVVPAFVLMIAGLVAIPYSGNFLAMLLSTGSVAAGVGVASPILIYWISLIAGGRKGESLGKQVAAASYGEAAGAVLGGVLFGYAAAPFLPFLVIGVLLLAALALSLRLPSALRPFTAAPAVHPI